MAEGLFNKRFILLEPVSFALLRELRVQIKGR
jgi:hypothetical protein